MPVSALARRIVPLTVRSLLAVTAWWILSEGDASAWAFGAPVIAFAIATRSALAEVSPPLVRPWGGLRFLAVFLAGLLRGGFDVAWRALSPRLPISPDFQTYEIRLSRDAPRRLLMMVVSVMPGTLSVDVQGTRLRLHVLVTTGDKLREQVEALEESIAHAFGEALGKAG